MFMEINTDKKTLPFNKNPAMSIPITEDNVTSEEVGLKNDLEEYSNPNENHYNMPPLCITEEEDNPSAKRPKYCYRPTCFKMPLVLQRFKGSIYLAFLSHTCFIIASLFYVRLGILQLSWFELTENRIPDGLLHQDDDGVWSSWANSSGDSTIADERDQYLRQSRFCYTLGALYFVFVGFLDWARYCDCLNGFMILAGAAGMVSGFSNTARQAENWNCISVHLYLLEAINLLTRFHDYEGHPCFRTSDISFSIGCVLDVIMCYLGLGGVHGVNIIYSDILSSFLWLACALIDLTAEIYYLIKHKRGGESLFCY